MLNTLSLIEFLLKNGDQKFKMAVEQEKFLVARQLEYESEEDPEDLTKSIVALSKKILSLLSNEEEY